MGDVVVQEGDVFAMGRHKLMCGDATNKEHVAQLFAGQKPTLVVTSPPYAKQRDYDRPIPCWDSMMMGALDGHDFADDVQMFINLGVIHAKNEWQPYWSAWVKSMRLSGWRDFSRYIWHKTTCIPGCMGNRLTPNYEFIFHINKSNPRKVTKWIVSVNKPRHQARKVITKNGYYLSCNTGSSLSKDRAVLSLAPERGRNLGHPATQPIALHARLFKSYKTQLSLAYDPFCGSGTTLHAAEAEGVTGLGMEISPAYCAIAIKRWNKSYPEQVAVKL